MMHFALLLSAATTATVSVDMQAGHPIVAAIINGTEQHFIIDSGAAASVIDSGVARGLRLRESSNAETARGELPTGVGTIAISDIALGSMPIPGARLIKVPLGLPGIAGIIGNDILSRFYWRLDPQAGMMTVSADELAVEPGTICEPNSRGVDRSAGLAGQLFVHVEVTGPGGPTSDVIAALDTGGQYSFMNWRAARAVGIYAGGPGTQATAPGTNHDPRLFATIPALRLGGVTVKQVQLRVADMPAFEAAELGARSGMILGMDVLRNFIIQADPGGRRTCFRSLATPT